MVEYIYFFKISNLRTVGTAPVLVGCREELVLMTTLSDQLRFLIEEGNVTSGQDAEFLRQTHQCRHENKFFTTTNQNRRRSNRS